MIFSPIKFFIYFRQAIQHDEISVGHHDKEGRRSYQVGKVGNTKLKNKTAVFENYFLKILRSIFFTFMTNLTERELYVTYFS